MTASLSADTAVVPLPKAPGWYTADLPPAWDFLTPSGGVLMSVALRAMWDTVGGPGSGLRPVSATTLFMSPVPNGPLDIRVELLRKGEAAAQARAALSSATVPGPGLEVSATFGIERAGPEFVDTAPPDVPPVQDCPSVEPMSAFHRNFDFRMGYGDVRLTETWAPAEHARFARWYRYLVPVVLPDGRLDPLAIPPIADNMPPAVGAKLGSDVPFYAPSLDLTVHFLEDVAATDAEWLLCDFHARRARGGFATATVNVWAGDRLIAFANQMMILRRPRAFD